MTARLLTIDPEPPVPADVIGKLTAICEWVEHDKVSSLGIAVVHRDGSVSTTWSTPCALVTLLGAVERLKHRLNAEMDAGHE
jgi:hypothetical protein